MIKIAFALVVLLFPALVSASSMGEIRYEEHKIDLPQARSLGLIPELEPKNKRGLNELNIQIPKNIEGRKFDFAIIVMYSHDVPVTSFLMTEFGRTIFGQEEMQYIGARLNKDVVSKVLVEVYTERNHLYVFQIDTSAL